LAREKIHDVVDMDKIEPESVQIVEKWDASGGEAKSDSPKTYKVVYSLPIAVSPTWQAMFQKPDPTRSGTVHQVGFTFSANGREVEAELRGEPSPELLLVLKSYAKRANKRWAPYREKVLDNKQEEERILNILKDAR